MIRYSHVSPFVPCELGGAASITAALGVEPSRVRETKAHTLKAGGVREEVMQQAWMLDSPKSHTEGDPTARLLALADIIEPFASRLQSCRSQSRPWVDVLYHLTPQHPDGVTGEFEWFVTNSESMRRFGAWDLGVSYESLWFDHPDWTSPTPGRWWSRLLASFRVRKIEPGKG